MQNEIFASPEALYNRIESYFYDCDHWGDKKKGVNKNKGKPYTLAGLCYFLRCTYKALAHYSTLEDYEEIIQNARLRIEAYIEELSLTTRFAAGPIFNLKARFGYQEIQVVEHKNAVKVVVSELEQGLFKRKLPPPIETETVLGEVTVGSDDIIEIDNNK